MTTDNLPALIDYCRNLAAGTMIPAQYRNAPANVMYAVEYADALAIPRINALTSIHVIDGKPSASADLIAGLVRKAGHKLRVSVERDDKGNPTAVAQIVRADDPDFTFETRWNLQRATAAGLAGKGNWKKYPEAMLKARAITEVAREAASDSLMGVIYTPEELGATVDQDGTPVQVESERVNPAPRQQQPRQQSAQGSPRDTVAAAINTPTETPAEDPEQLLAEAELAAGDKDALGALWKRAAGLPADDIHPVRAAIEALAAAATPTPEEAAQTVTDVLDAEVVEDAA